MRGGGSATIKGVLESFARRADAVSPEYRKGFEDGGTASEYMGGKVSIDKGDAVGAKGDAGLTTEQLVKAVQAIMDGPGTDAEKQAAVKRVTQQTKLDAACAKVDAITGTKSDGISLGTSQSPETRFSLGRQDGYTGYSRPYDPNDPDYMRGYTESKRARQAAGIENWNGN